MSTSARRLIVLCSMLAALASCRSPQLIHWRPDARTGAPPHAKTPLPPKNEFYEVIGYVPGLRSYVVKYDYRLYRGGDVLSEEGVQILKEHDIRTIISVTPTPLERGLAEAYGIELVEIPFERERVPKEVLWTFLETTGSGKAPFYLHCNEGKHRGGALAAAYRVFHRGWRPEDAAEEFRLLGGDLEKDRALLTFKESGDAERLRACMFNK